MPGCVITLGLLLVLFWIADLALRFIISPLIHVLLVVGLILLIYQLVIGRRQL